MDETSTPSACALMPRVFLAVVWGVLGGLGACSGKESADAFQFFVGACTWSPGQLEEEMERGYWVTATVRDL